ncbi:hypothetical protein EON66_06285 [archaeon]|nr:MAG: hypothetical protein EON66_06285 [archaeon]
MQALDDMMRELRSPEFQNILQQTMNEMATASSQGTRTGQASSAGALSAAGLMSTLAPTESADEMANLARTLEVGDGDVRCATRHGVSARAAPSRTTCARADVATLGG